MSQPENGESLPPGQFFLENSRLSPIERYLTEISHHPMWTISLGTAGMLGVILGSEVWQRFNAPQAAEARLINTPPEATLTPTISPTAFSTVEQKNSTSSFLGYHMDIPQGWIRVDNIILRINRSTGGATTISAVPGKTNSLEEEVSWYLSPHGRSQILKNEIANNSAILEFGTLTDVVKIRIINKDGQITVFTAIIPTSLFPTHERIVEQALNSLR